MSTGTTIKRLREQSGMTQEELALRLGVKKAAVNKYETGRVINLKRSTIEKLCRIFDVMPQDILGISDGGEEDGSCPESLTHSDEDKLLKLISLMDTKKQIELRDYLDKIISDKEKT